MMLLLAGCGKSSNTVVTGTYYNPSKDAENTAQIVGTEADANNVLDAMEQGTEQEGTSIGADLFLITNYAGGVPDFNTVELRQAVYV